MYVSSTLTLSSPAKMITEAGETSWLIPFTLPLILSLFMLWVYGKLNERFPNQDFYHTVKIITGKWGARGIGAAFIFYFLVLEVIVVRTFTDFVNLAILPHTPLWVLVLTLALVATYGAYLGIEVIVRANQFVFPLYVIAVCLTFGLLIPDIVPYRLLPLFKDGFMPVLQGSAIPSIWYGEIVIYPMLLPLLNNYADYKKKTVIALVSISLLTTAEIALGIMIFGVPAAGRHTYLFWALGRGIEFQDYFERIESVLVMLWMTGVVIKVAVLCYLLIKITASTFSLKNKQVLLGINFIIKVAASIFLFKGVNQLSLFLFDYWTYLAALFQIIIPTALFMLAVLRKKGKKGTVR